MKKNYFAKRHSYTKLGMILRAARKSMKNAGHNGNVKDLAEKLKMSVGFVYLVEQGKRKPQDSHIAMWASIYGLNHIDLWKSLNRVPMDLVATLKETNETALPDSFSHLTEMEKSELFPFLNFVRWKISNKISGQKS